MKHLLKLSFSERFILMFALRKYIKSLEDSTTRKGYAPFAKMAASKIIKGAPILVDGGEMITFVEALRNRADYFYQNNRLFDSEFCLSLAKYIDLERKFYQYTNGPVNKKSS